MAGPDFIYAAFMAVALGFFVGLMFSWFFDWVKLT